MPLRIPGADPLSSALAHSGARSIANKDGMAMQQMLKNIGVGDQAMRYEEFYGH